MKLSTPAVTVLSSLRATIAPPAPTTFQTITRPDTRPLEKGVDLSMPEAFAINLDSPTTCKIHFTKPQEGLSCFSFFASKEKEEKSRQAAALASLSEAVADLTKEPPAATVTVTVEAPGAVEPTATVTVSVLASVIA